jgi:CheY-like chemotaxis protein
VPFSDNAEVTTQTLVRVSLLFLLPIVATQILKKSNCHVTSVANGQEAVDMLKVRPFDVVLMDCQKPEMDGFEATKQIRMLEAHGILPHIPIIALTANAMKGDKEKCLASGMDDYLSKPIRQQDVQQMVERWASA